MELPLPENLAMQGQMPPEQIDPAMLALMGGQPMQPGPMQGPMDPPPIFDAPLSSIPGLPEQMMQEQALQAQEQLPPQELPIPQGLPLAPDVKASKYGPDTNYHTEVQSDNTMVIRRINPDGSMGPVTQIVKLKK
jgi:hypothetical protein